MGYGKISETKSHHVVLGFVMLLAMFLVPMIGLLILLGWNQ